MAMPVTGPPSLLTRAEAETPLEADPPVFEDLRIDGRLEGGQEPDAGRPGASRQLEGRRHRAGGVLVDERADRQRRGTADPARVEDLVGGEGELEDVQALEEEG